MTIFGLLYGLTHELHNNDGVVTLGIHFTQIIDKTTVCDMVL